MIRRTLPILLSIVALSGCGDGGADGALQGYVEGEYLRIAAPEGGWLTGLAVRDGQSVAAGDALFTLDDTRERAARAEAEARLAQARAQLADLLQGRRPEEVAQVEARLAQARAGLAYAEAEYKRQRDLMRADVAAKARLDLARSSAEEARALVAAGTAELATARLPARADQIAAAEAAVAAAEAAVAQADWRLSQRRIVAPAAGLVDDTLRDPGEWVPAGGVVVSLLPPEQRKLVFFLPEPRRAGVRPGDELAIGCDGCPDGLRARVRWIAAAAEFTPPVIYSLETRAKLVFRAEAEPLGPALELAPGQPVDLRPVGTVATAAAGAP